MIILTDCMHEVVDEGCIKLANSLVRLIKSYHLQSTVISYKNKNELSDVSLNLNKFFLNRRLFDILKDQRQVLYIPQASNSTGSIIRLWILSHIMRCKVTALFSECKGMNLLKQSLLKASGCKVVALSEEACYEFEKAVDRKVLYLRCGVDTQRFFPVEESRKKDLRKKYELPEGKKILLHVGHLTRGRNLAQLLKVKNDWHVVIVVSTHTREALDETLKRELFQRGNIDIIDTYQGNIEEFYQAADVYFFPVVEKGNCISAPLSVFEAAACNIPVVATKYGNLIDFLDEPGFCFLESFAPDEINQKISEMERIKVFDNRTAILGYDWNNAYKSLIKYMDEEKTGLI